MMGMRIQDIVDALEKIAPPEYAASWDNTGLQIGAPGDPVRVILVALDITQGVVQEALAKKADLIVTHHPFFFHPVRQVRTDSGSGRLLKRLIRGGIAVYAAHTNLDVVRDGVNDILVKALGLEEWGPLQEISAPEGTGWGGIGVLDEAKTFAAFTAGLKKALQIKWFRVIGRPPSKVRKVACCSGSGAGLFPEVVRRRPDVFITGDIKYHEALGFRAEGITVLDIGHFASEQGIRGALARRLRQSVKQLGGPVPVYTSRSEQDPFVIV